MRWARALEAIARSGLTYSQSPYERERFEAVRSIAAEIAAAASDEDAAVLHARFADEYGYATPKVDVRGVVLDDRGLLLVREIGETRWTLPGGWADVGETPRRAVEKEVQQEAGLDVSAARVLAVYDRDFRGRTQWPAHVYKLYVRCDVLGGEPKGDGLDGGGFVLRGRGAAGALAEDAIRASGAGARPRVRPGTRRGARLSPPEQRRLPACGVPTLIRVQEVLSGPE